jgi:peroxiredoxin
MGFDTSRAARARTSRHRNLLIALAIGVTAAGGVYVGARIAARSRPDPFPGMQRGVPTFLLASEAHFPTAQLLGEDGVPHATEDLLGPQGTVILFLDPSCDPCKPVARKWQQHSASGRLGNVGILGISASDRGSVARYRARLSLDYPILTDPDHVYITRYGIDTYPWEIVVDGRGRVVSYTGVAQEMASLSSLRSLLD